MKRYLMISADCHVGPPTAQYRSYLDPKFRRSFDEYLAKLRQTMVFENAAKLYGFNLKRLAPMVKKVGPMAVV